MTTLSLEQVIAITRCPDWPDERVEALAKRFAGGITPAQIIELAEEGAIPKGDAIWLLLQSETFDGPQLACFGFDVVLRATLHAYTAIPANATNIPRCADVAAVVFGPAEANRINVFKLEINLRAIAVELQIRKLPSVTVWRVFRASRIVGLYTSLITYAENLESYAQQISAIAYRCTPDARAEKEAQFACLKKLVTA